MTREKRVRTVRSVAAKRPSAPLRRAELLMRGPGISACVLSENLDGDIGTPEEIRERWEEVVFLVGIFKEVRSQERR